MSTIITITNQKGGVGKTTTSSALMDGLRSRGARVLGVDLDPQGSLGFCLGLDIEHCATIYDALNAGIFCRPTSCCPLPSWSLTGPGGNFC